MDGDKNTFLISPPYVSKESLAEKLGFFYTFTDSIKEH
jgi:hypothetical protein